MNAMSYRDDEQLIELFLCGESAAADSAFEALVTRHRRAVLTVCRWILQIEDAEDAAQVTFLALFRNADKIRDRRVLESWLCGVAYRVAVRMKAQSHRRRELHSRATKRRPPERAEDAAAFNELQQILHDEVHQLPENFRTLVVYSYLVGESNEELARSIGCPIGTVKGRLWRARELLRERLSKRVGGAIEVFA
jgi:RNA polymerase sigma factor (sigma-70 family)